MNVVLFEGPDDAVYPVSERPPGRGEDEPPNPGDSWWRRVKRSTWQAYAKLKDQFDYFERFCGGLRHAEHLRVVHSPRRSPADAEKKLRDFLQLSYSKHGRWTAVDGVLAGLGVGLFWLPGPNIFFFYPAVRALSHHLARQGAAKALDLPMTFDPDGRIDRVPAESENLEAGADLLNDLEQAYNLDNVLNILKSLRKK